MSKLINSLLLLYFGKLYLFKDNLVFQDVNKKKPRFFGKALPHFILIKKLNFGTLCKFDFLQLNFGTLPKYRFFRQLVAFLTHVASEYFCR